MNIKSGMKFYDVFSGIHEITKIENGIVFHNYNDGKRKVNGQMYLFVLENYIKKNIVCVL